MALRYHILIAAMALTLGSGPCIGAQTAPTAKAKPAAKAKSKPAEEKRMTDSYKDFGGDKDAFRCSVPAGWRQTRDEREEARSRTFGVMLRGPAGAEDVPPVVSLRYYGPGNPTAQDAEAFLKRQLQPSLVQPQGEETSKVSDASVAGLKARTFTRTTSELVPPDTLDAKEVRVRQDVYVIAHAPGYFVLRFSAPRSSFDTWKPVFQKVRDSFKPNKR